VIADDGQRLLLRIGNEGNTWIRGHGHDENEAEALLSAFGLTF
jgi:hypothetical protein